MSSGDKLTDDIKMIRQLTATARLDEVGRVYLSALERSAIEYGLEGLQMQVLYLLAGGRWSDPEARQQLERYTKTGSFERPTKKPSRRR